MDKKVPERKVFLREDDVVYVYDKRINRCVKEDCVGTVKYGLVLRVSVNDTETLNCFECNKCHMKYTPYPNYVRLTKTDMLDIYNKTEVAARDRKRALDAIRHPAKDKKNLEETSTQKKSKDKSSHGKRTYDKKKFDNRQNVNKSYNKKSFDKKPYEKTSDDTTTFKNRGLDGNRSNSDRKSYDRIPNTNGGYKKPFCSEKNYYKKDSNTSGKTGIFLVPGGYRKKFEKRNQKPDEKTSEE